MAGKQVIVMRKDLGMRKGKMVAQGAHASMAAVLSVGLDDPRVADWLSGPFAKICVSVNSEAELLELHEKAKAAGAITALITDSGRTEFNGVPTNTCIAVGPGAVADIDAITGHLSLL